MRKKEKEITDLHDLESVIMRSDVCRVAFAAGNVPYIVTMNFGFSAGSKRVLFFHCAPEGRKLEMMRQNNFVCFEMDTDHELIAGSKACDCSMKYSSIVGYGYISAVKDPAEKARGLDCIMSHYSPGGEFIYDKDVLARTAILKLDITEMQGKRS